jgi:hypothetical protein
VTHSDGIITLAMHRRFGFNALVFRSLLLLVVSVLAVGGALAAESQRTPGISFGPGHRFAVSDFDGDLRPDLADVQVGRSDVSLTDYWIQLDLTTAGRQAILVVAPAGGLQIVARDVNGDHAPDLVLTTAWLKQPVAILLNDGHGGFSKVDPNVFPEAFGNSKTRWETMTIEEPEINGFPSQSRLVVCAGTTRLPHPRDSLDVLGPSECGIPSHAVVDSHPGRAPPSEVPQL